MYNNKTNIILTAISLLVLLLVTVSASYAYFASKIDVGNGLVVGANTSGPPTFTAYTADDLSLNVTGEDMFDPSITAVKTDTGRVIASLASPTNGSTIFCTYNIELIWDTTDQYITPTATLGGDYPFEISLSATQSVNGDTTGSTYSVTSLNETNLTSFTWSGTNGVIGRKTQVITGAKIYSKSTIATTATWDFTLRFYALPTDQSGIAGKNYGAHLTVSDVVC